MRIIYTILLAAFLLTSPAFAGVEKVLLREVTGGGDAATEAPAVPVDPLGRNSPRGLVTGFIDAIMKEDFEKAAQYLQLSDVPASKRVAHGKALAKTFLDSLDKGGWFYPSAMLSDQEGGKEGEDKLSADKDIVGELHAKDQKLQIHAIHAKITNGSFVWLISEDTLNKVDTLFADVADTEPLINKVLPDSLTQTKFFGAPVGHWVAALALMLLSYISCWFLILTLLGFMKNFCQKKIAGTGVHFLETVRVPVSLYAAVWVFALSCLWLDLSVIVRQYASQLNVIVSWTAIALLAWRLVDFGAELVQKKINSQGRFFGYSSILFFFRRIVKVIFGTVIAFIILDNLGVDVTAGLAALGIGGIALALGAQKTLENFIGSLAIIIDRPFHIGDTCKIGGMTGTVEDIGMRSTRIRTVEKSVVTIPNGDLSNERIENLARRNRFLMQERFILRYDTTATQIRALQEKVIDILKEDTHTTEEAFPARLLGPVDNGWNFEIFCYVEISDFNENLRVQHEIFLKIIEFMNENKIYCAIPSQTFLPAVDQVGAKPIAQ